MSLATLEVTMALLAAYYAGANIGSLAVATGKTLADNFDLYSLLHPEDYKDINNNFDFEKWINDLNREGKYHVYDPLVLDLDGDGIETIAAGDFTGALFDHDNDGIRTATGWVKADDGILMVDRNGDGLINDGSELFGDSTILADGSTSTHGYAVLEEYDSNDDGKMNADDAYFTQLRVWRDLNQDGISQSDELFTLDAVGVQSLNLAYQNTNTSLGNGNTLAQTGSYETTNGSTQKMGDVNFAYDALYSEFTDSIELTAEQLQAANLKGIGRVRDLREAAALSSELGDLLKAYSVAETRAEQLALLDELVLAWAKTDTQFGTAADFALGTWTQSNSGGVALTPSQSNALGLSPPGEELAQIAQINEKIKILNAFTGETSSTFYARNSADLQKIIETVNSTYASLEKNIYSGLLFQTRLQTYLNQMGFKIENDQFVLDFTGITAACCSFLSHPAVLQSGSVGLHHRLLFTKHNLI